MMDVSGYKYGVEQQLAPIRAIGIWCDQRLHPAHKTHIPH